MAFNIKFQKTKGGGTEFLGSLMYRSLIEKMLNFQKVNEFWKWQSVSIPKIPTPSIWGNFWRFQSIWRRRLHNSKTKIA